MKDFAGRVILCYTLFSTFALNTTEPYTVEFSSGIERKTKSVKLFSAELDFEGSEYWNLNREVSARIAIHQPTVLVNSFTMGFRALPQRAIIVQVSMTEYNLLPSPYESNCFDYKAQWIEKGGPRPLSKEMCLEECNALSATEICGCSTNAYIYPHNLPICKHKDDIECTDINAIAIERNCRKHCEKPCRYVVYDYSVNQKVIDIKKTEYEENDTEVLMQKNKGTIDIYLKRSEVIVYKFRPKYESIETFSYVGGYVGIWLGISLIAVFDFVESMVLLFSYICKRMQSPCKRREKRS